jgi:phosphoserine phosphatase
VTAFKSVVLDVDSTVSAIEGIDWLAEQRDALITETIVALTADAMEARVPLDEVYGRRLALIRPTRDEIVQLAQVYITAAMPGVHDAVSAWLAAGIRVVLVSGGLRDAILPLATWLGIPAADVHAVDVEYDADGIASGILDDALLARRGGKLIVVEALQLARPILAVGDGATDADLAPTVDQFLAFTGVARRASVVARAAGEVHSFAALTPIVLGL